MTKKLIVEVREDKVYVTGNLEDKGYCIAMLEEAIEAVKKWRKPILSIPTVNELKKINK